MNAFVKRVLFAVALVAGAGLAFAPSAEARSFTITNLDVNAVIAPDGTMSVTENVTYDFDGQFNGIDRSIPPGFGYEIVDIAATEGGQPVVVLDADPAHFSIDSPNAPITGVHTFTITYRVLGAVDVYPDVAELYWKLVGTEAPKIGHVTGTFTFPEGSAPLKAWAHGPLEGVVQPSGNVVTLEVAPLPANTFLEVRVAASPSAFTVPPSGGPRLPTIEAEEAQFAADANAERQRLKDELERDRQIRNFGAVAGPVLGIVAFFGFLAIWRAWGKEPDAPPDVGDYYREVPEEPPAVVEAFIGWGSVPRTAFGSTVVDLAQRGYLTINEEVHEKIGKDKVEYTFTSTGKPADANGCSPYERDVLDRLFSAGPTITQDELVDRAEDDRTEAVAWWEGFRSDVKRDLETHQYFNEKGRFRPYCLHSLLVLGAIGGGILLIVAGAVLGGIVLLVFGVVLMLLSGLLRQRTPEGARKQAELSGLRRFLRDFSRLDDAPVGDLILYERYLVYAVALGVSKELMEGLQARVPELANQTTSFAPWYVGSAMSANRFDSLSSVGTFATHFSSATAAAFSPPSSASGGGGGFSGGGGGGGGGGGFGAH